MSYLNSNTLEDSVSNVSWRNQSLPLSITACQNELNNIISQLSWSRESFLFEPVVCCGTDGNAHATTSVVPMSRCNYLKFLTGHCPSTETFCGFATWKRYSEDLRDEQTWHRMDTLPCFFVFVELSSLQTLTINHLELISTCVLCPVLVNGQLFQTNFQHLNYRTVTFASVDTHLHIISIPIFTRIWCVQNLMQNFEHLPDLQLTDSLDTP